MFSKVFAQQSADNCKNLEDIAAMERAGHERLMNANNVTSASNNFDVKYYRCEWEVDPVVRFIKGKVTAYFTVTAAATSISFDLASSLLTDSVRQRNTKLNYQHTNNTLQINFTNTLHFLK